jgi:CheY-like chemotaxis protein
VVDDEPDVEALFRQQFRRDLRLPRFVMDFANSAAEALARIASTIEQSLILSDINMPGMTGLEMLPKVREIRSDVPVIMIPAKGVARENSSRFEERGIVERLDHGVDHVGGAVVLALFEQFPHLAQIGAHRRLQRRIALDQGPRDAERDAFGTHLRLLDRGFAHGRFLLPHVAGAAVSLRQRPMSIARQHGERSHYRGY